MLLYAVLPQGEADEDAYEHEHGDAKAFDDMQDIVEEVSADPQQLRDGVRGTWSFTDHIDKTRAPFKKWNFLNNTMPLAVRVNQDEAIVERAKQECEAICEELCSTFNKRTTDELESLTPCELVMPFIRPFLEKVTEMSSIGEGEKFALEDLLRYIITRERMSFFGASATELFSPDEDVSSAYGGPKTQLRAEYDRVHRKIRMSRTTSRERSWRTRASNVSDHREYELQFSHTFRKIVLHLGITWSIVDDDKIPHGSKLALEFGAKMFYTRGGKSYPVRHVMASVITGLVSALILDVIGIPPPPPQNQYDNI